MTVWYFDREERKRAKQQQQVDGAYEQYSLLSLNLSFCVLLFSPIEFNYTVLLLSACSHCGKANTIFFIFTIMGSRSFSSSIHFVSNVVFVECKQTLRYLHLDVFWTPVE